MSAWPLWSEWKLRAWWWLDRNFPYIFALLVGAWLLLFALLSGER